MLFVGLMGPSVTKRFGYKGPLLISAFGMFLSLVSSLIHLFSEC